MRAAVVAKLRDNADELACHVTAEMGKLIVHRLSRRAGGGSSPSTSAR